MANLEHLKHFKNPEKAVDLENKMIQGEISQEEFAKEIKKLKLWAGEEAIKFKSETNVDLAKAESSSHLPQQEIRATEQELHIEENLNAVNTEALKVGKYDYLKAKARNLLKVAAGVVGLAALPHTMKGQAPKERAPKVYTNKAEYDKAKQAYDDSMALYKMNQGKNFDERFYGMRDRLDPNRSASFDSGYIEEIKFGSKHDIDKENEPGYKGSVVEYTRSKEPMGTDWTTRPGKNIRESAEEGRNLDSSNRRLYDAQEKEIRRAIDEWNKSNDKKLGNLMRKYKPIGYLNKEEYSEGYLGDNYAINPSAEKYKKPHTWKMEDATDREGLKKIYPGLTDKDIDEAIENMRTRDPLDYMKKGVGPYDRSWEEPDYYERNYTQDSTKGYRPEAIVNQIHKFTYSLPIWKKPVQPVEFEFPTERISLGTFNVHGQEFKYYSPGQKNDILNKLEAHNIKATKVGATENYTVARFQEKTKGWQGNKLLDEKGEVLVDLDIINKEESPKSASTAHLDVALEGQVGSKQKKGVMEKRLETEKAPTFREWFIQNHLDPKVLSNTKDLAKVQEIYDKEYPNNLTKNDKSKAFLANWYKNREIPDKDLQREFEKDRQGYLERIKNFPNYNYVGSIDAPGFDSKNIRGQYDDSTDEVSLRPFAPDYVKTHELNHFIRKDKTSEGLEQYSIKDEDSSNEKKEFYRYVYDSEEMHSRVMVLREAAGIDPKQVVDEEFLYNFIEKYKKKPDNPNINILLKYLKFEDLLYLLNDMVSNEKPKKMGESKVYEG